VLAVRDITQVNSSVKLPGATRRVKNPATNATSMANSATATTTSI
jgi:hypothetical protein